MHDSHPTATKTEVFALERSTLHRAHTRVITCIRKESGDVKAVRAQSVL